MKTRIFKFALNPTEMQRKQLERCGHLTRFLWNRLVKTQKHAFDEIKNGRRATIENEYRELFANKELVGMRVKVVNDLALEKNISPEDALSLFVKEKTQKDTAIVIRKKDRTRALNWSARHLSWKYAVEKVNSQRENFLPPDMLAIWTGIQAKWIDFAESWDKGIFQSPRRKKFGQISAIQKQIAKSSKFVFGEYIDLSWAGSPCLEKTKVIKHRDIPDGTTIKQIALVKNSVNRWFVCIFLEAEDVVFQRKFTQTEKIVGIDPGMKSALTTSDGKVIQPIGISRHNRKERKLKRLQRKFDRQFRLNNPHCFNVDGTWKRGQKIKIRTKGMLESALSISDIKRYYKDAKADFYHNAAIQLLNQYDVVGVGNAKMHSLVRGKGKAKRASNMKVREHAIADFVSKLKDKASLSLTPKQVYGKVSEINTTKRCSHCGELTGPSGINELNIRQWTCSKCGIIHNRDVNAAKNIRSNTISIMKTAASQSVSGEKSPKVRRSTKGKVTPKGNCPRSMETTKSQDGGLTQTPFASVQVMAQTSVSSRSLQMSVTERDMQVSPSADSVIPSEKMGLSQSQICTTVTQRVTTTGLQ